MIPRVSSDHLKSPHTGIRGQRPPEAQAIFGVSPLVAVREGPGVLVGLYYYRLRYYDPEAGRFVSRDPLGMWGDAGQRGNAQNYCGNNPINLVDPLGLDGDKIKWEARQNKINEKLDRLRRDYEVRAAANAAAIRKLEPYKFPKQVFGKLIKWDKTGILKKRFDEAIARGYDFARVQMDQVALTDRDAKRILIDPSRVSSYGAFYAALVHEIHHSGQKAEKGPCKTGESREDYVKRATEDMLQRESEAYQQESQDIEAMRAANPELFKDYKNEYKGLSLDQIKKKIRSNYDSEKRRKDLGLRWDSQQFKRD